MTPAQVAHIMPPLPKPLTLSRGDEDGAIQLGYTAEQMQTYARSAVEAALRDAPQQADPVGCFRCVTPKKCAIYGCCPNTWPSEKATPSAPTAVEPVQRWPVSQDPLTQLQVAAIISERDAPTAEQSSVVQPRDERTPLTRSQINKASGDAQTAFCLGKQPTYEVALAREVEKLHGITARASKGTK